MPVALQSAINQLLEQFSAEVVTAIRAASLEELGRDRPSRQGSRRPRGAARAASRRASRPPAGRGKQNAIGADTVLDHLVDIVRKHPKGLRSEDLRAQLGVEKVPFRLVARAAEEAGLIGREGEKRSTTFFAK